MLEAYPVISEHRFEPYIRPWARYRRRAELLPPRREGTARVFEVDGGFFAENPGPQRASAPLITRAQSVSIVDMLARLVVVNLPLPGDTGVLRVGLQCQVTDPVPVARRHLTDLALVFDTYFRYDHGLQRLYSSPTGNGLHREIVRRLMAHLSVRPVRVAGMRITQQYLVVDA